MEGITSKGGGIHPNHQVRHSHIERYWSEKFSGERRKS